MANRYGAGYRNGNGYGNFGRPQQPSVSPSPSQLSLSSQQQPPPPQQISPARQRLQQQQQDDYDPYGDGYSSGAANGGGTRRGGGGADGYVSSSSRGGDRGGDRDRRGAVMGPASRRFRQEDDSYGNDEDDQFDDRGPPPPSQRRRQGMQQPQQRDYRQGGYGGGPNASSDRRIGQDALDRIRAEWPAMYQTDCVPVQMALQLLDGSSVGRAHEYRAFQRTHQYLQDSLKGIVHDYHQGFNSSIGTFHKIQSSIQASQLKVRGLKETLAASRASLCKTDPELAKLYAASQQYDDLLQTLGDLDELRQVPERLEARISEKQFLTAVDVLQHALRKLRKPELDGIGALADLRSYLANQETALMDILVEELHEHLYLKSPYCQERWQALARHQGSGSGGGSATSAAAASSSSGGAAGSRSLAPKPESSLTSPSLPDSHFLPFFLLLDGMDLEHAVREDPARNPEGDTFYYITLVIESLNKLGRLEAAVDQLKQRLPVELFGVVHETVNEIDQKHPSSLRGSGAGGRAFGRIGPSGAAGGGVSASGMPSTPPSQSAGVVSAAGGSSAGLHIYGSRETQMRADVIYDLLWTLYGKFEAIAEGHRIFHEYIKALIRREGAGNNSALLGSFKELWNLYQNEIRSLLHNYVTTDADLYRSGSGSFRGLNGSVLAGGAGRRGAGGAGTGRDSIFKFNEADAKSLEMATEYDDLDGIIRAAVPGLTSNGGASLRASGGGAGRKAGGGAAAGDAKKGRKSYGSPGLFLGDQQQLLAAGGGSGDDLQKPLVEPSVFNMSLLLPPTLVFLQRLRGIVPPGSDLAASTLTSFLDNFLVNVFQPQLDETLGKLSDAVFGEADAFQADPTWSQMARRPVFKGTTAFFSVVTAFCRMLGTIPHDQALSALMITQMVRYYDRCFSWYKALVTKVDTADQADPTALAMTNPSADGQRLRASAVLALEDGEIAKTARALWAVDEELADAADGAVAAVSTNGELVQKKAELLKQEVDLLLARASRGPSGAPQQRLGLGDVISDRDAITSLCLLYTSMKWLAVKIGGLRHITQQDADAAAAAAAAAARGTGAGGAGGVGGAGASAASSALAKPDKRRWTNLGTEPSKALADGGPVYLPMTQETVQWVLRLFFFPCFHVSMFV